MIEKVMIDSSCWIKFLRSSDKKIADKVEKLIDNDLAVTCGVIELEIIQGIKSNKQREIVKNLFEILEYFEVYRNDYINAGERLKKFRDNGITLSPSDALIAEICIRNNISLFTLDKDFNYIKELKKY